MHWLYLAIAIVGGVVGASAMKASDGFVRLGPSLIVAGVLVLNIFPSSVGH